MSSIGIAAGFRLSSSQMPSSTPMNSSPNKDKSSFRLQGVQPNKIASAKTSSLQGAQRAQQAIKQS